MNGGYITGKEIIGQCGKLAVEIGQACYDGTICAFTETLTPVVEGTKLGKIPKYPPVGVNPLDHVQYAISPKWDWWSMGCLDVGLCHDYSIEPRNIKILRYGAMIPSDEPREPSFLGLDEDKSSCDGVIPFELDVCKLNRDAIQFAHDIKYGVYGKEKMSLVDIVELAALGFMEKSFNYYSDCKINDDIGVKIFFFLLNDYTTEKNNDQQYSLSLLCRNYDKFRRSVLHGTPLSTSDELHTSYKVDIESFIFRRRDIEAWLNCGARQAKPPTVNNLAQGGSRPRTNDRNETKNYCLRITANCANYVDSSGVIGLDEFSKAVQDAMLAAGVGGQYHGAAAKEFFRASTNNPLPKRSPGKRKK
jgi:hypothetical protein